MQTGIEGHSELKSTTETQKGDIFWENTKTEKKAEYVRLGAQHLRWEGEEDLAE